MAGSYGFLVPGVESSQALGILADSDLHSHCLLLSSLAAIVQVPEDGASHLRCFHRRNPHQEHHRPTSGRRTPSRTSFCDSFLIQAFFVIKLLIFL